jgi:hypothetical protein
MAIKCDICGFEHESTAHFCGKCGVDLTEPIEANGAAIDTKPLEPVRKKPSSASKKDVEDTKNDDLIKWCSISALCNSHEMTFPIFFNMVLIFGDGRKQLGFCDCVACNLGYRELLAFVTSATENKKLKASSREIVIKAREMKIAGKKFNISDFLSRENIPGDNNSNKGNELQKVERVSTGKILIEIDSGVLENAVINVLKSEEGRGIIRQIKNEKRKVQV